MPGHDYMHLALNLASKAKERTYPNPMVGAIIVKNGRIEGRGYHKKAGCDHAEVMAIKNAGTRCRGGEMYVTLEPCDHWGRTPPCTETIIKSGIKHVIIGMLDPNPVNTGKGIKKLKRSGIKISMGRYEKEIAFLNRKYIKSITTGMPYITLKSAQTLDGKIAARDGSSKWVSNNRSRNYAKRLRSRYNAIMIGTNTLVNDDPFLLDEKKSGYNVCRVVIDSSLKIPLSSNIIKTSEKSPVIIATTEKAPQNKISKLKNITGVQVIQHRSKKGRVSLLPLFKELYKRGLINVLVEGGGELAGSLLDASLIDEVMFFVSPKLLGGDKNSIKGKGVSTINKALELNNISIKKISEDLLITGVVNN